MSHSSDDLIRMSHCDQREAFIDSYLEDENDGVVVDEVEEDEDHDLDQLHLLLAEQLLLVELLAVLLLALPAAFVFDDPFDTFVAQP